MATQPVRRMTPEEYLAFERASEFRHEYIDGFLVAMSGGTDAHNTIAMNLYGLFWGQLRGKSCKPYPSDMRVQVSEDGLYTYPDLTVVCGERQFRDGVRDQLLNPTLIFEILSPSSESYDRGLKFARYRQVPSLQEYVLVAQDRHSVERFSRQGTSWVLTEVNGPDGQVEFLSVGCTLNMSDIYEGVEFSASEARE